MTAAGNCQIDIVQLLLESGADVNLSGDGGESALMAAGDDPKIVEALLKAGAKSEAVDKRGGTAVWLR